MTQQPVRQFLNGQCFLGPDSQLELTGRVRYCMVKQYMSAGMHIDFCRYYHQRIIRQRNGDILAGERILLVLNRKVRHQSSFTRELAPSYVTIVTMFSSHTQSHWQQHRLRPLLVFVSMSQTRKSQFIRDCLHAEGVNASKYFLRKKMLHSKLPIV